jgi:hypothetical protein
MSQSFGVSSFFAETSKPGVLKGQLLDGENNNEPLAFATIEIAGLNEYLTTDENGCFSVRLKANTYNLVISFIGYESLVVENISISSSSETFINPTLNALTFNPPLKVDSEK